MDNLLLVLVVPVIPLEYLNLIQQKTYQEIHLLSKRKKNMILIFSIQFFINIPIYSDHRFQKQVDVYLDQPNQ
jgi:hypothetical protein